MDRESNHQAVADAPLVRRRDQVVIALCVLATCAAMAVYLVWHTGWFGAKLIDIDRAEPRRATFEVNINTAEWPEITSCNY